VRLGTPLVPPMPELLPSVHTCVGLCLFLVTTASFSWPRPQRTADLRMPPPPALRGRLPRWLVRALLVVPRLLWGKLRRTEPHAGDDVAEVLPPEAGSAGAPSASDESWHSSVAPRLHRRPSISHASRRKIPGGAPARTSLALSPSLFPNLNTFEEEIPHQDRQSKELFGFRRRLRSFLHEMLPSEESPNRLRRRSSGIGCRPREDSSSSYTETYMQEALRIKNDELHLLKRTNDELLRGVDEALELLGKEAPRAKLAAGCDRCSNARARLLQLRQPDGESMSEMIGGWSHAPDHRLSGIRACALGEASKQGQPNPLPPSGAPTWTNATRAAGVRNQLYGSA